MLGDLLGTLIASLIPLPGGGGGEARFKRRLIEAEQSSLPIEFSALLCIPGKGGNRAGKWQKGSFLIAGSQLTWSSTKWFARTTETIDLTGMTLLDREFSTEPGETTYQCDFADKSIYLTVPRYTQSTVEKRVPKHPNWLRHTYTSPPRSGA